MTIGTSDGRQFESERDYLLENRPITGNMKGGGLPNPEIRTVKPPRTDDPNIEVEPRFPTFQGEEGMAYDPWPSKKVNYEYNVPLVASAIMGKDGRMNGMAVDHRLSPSDDDLQLLHLHESTELPWMQDYIKAGLSPAEAYRKAHDYATARETAASIAKWGEAGHEQYQQRMRDNAKIAAEPSDRDRHPDAHTTKYGLDESELGMKFAQNLAVSMPEDITSESKEHTRAAAEPAEIQAGEHKRFHPLSILGAPPVAGVISQAQSNAQQIDVSVMGNPPSAPKFFNPKPERISEATERKSLEEAERESKGPEEKIEPPEDRDPEDLDLDLPDIPADYSPDFMERMKRLLETIGTHPSTESKRRIHKRKAKSASE